MAKSRRVIVRQTITIVAALVAAFSFFFSVILNSAVSETISCLNQSAEEESVCMDCCAGIGTSPNCCCYFSEMSNQNDSLIIYEPFGKSVYSYMCNINKFDKTNFMELYNVNCETQGSRQYIAFDIFRPPKA
jgi:hypothetical protein